MTLLELIAYYVNLLIIQYHGKEKAEATIETVVTPTVMPQASRQTITFSSAPSSGTFTLSYDDEESVAIQWNYTGVQVGNVLGEITTLDGPVIVTGEIADLVLTVTILHIFPPAQLFVVETNTLSDGSPITITIAAVDDPTLPIAVQNAFNLNGDDTAVGVQLDIIGKYVGVSRTGPGFYSQITLDDTDYLSLIRMAIAQNSAGSSLAEIQAFLFQFFPGQILVFDYQNMQMSYLISSSVGSAELVQLFINEGLLPKPMAVQVAVVIYAPVIDMFFGFRTYELPAFNVTPFNDYTDYQEDWPWLSYGNAVVI